MQWSQDCKLKILICFKSPITKHWTRLHKTSHVLPIPLPNWKISVMLKVLGEELKISLSFRIRKTMFEDLILFEFLLVCSLAYPPWCNKYIIIFSILLSKKCFNHDESLPNLIKEKTSIGRWKVRNNKRGPKSIKEIASKSKSKLTKTPK